MKTILKHTLIITATLAAMALWLYLAYLVLIFWLVGYTILMVVCLGALTVLGVIYAKILWRFEQ